MGLAAAVLAGMFATASAQSQQPLGDYARAARKEKEKDQKSAKKYDNDNLPVNDKLSIVGSAPADQPAAGATTAPPDSAAASPKSGDTPADKQKLYDDWKSKIAAQKDQINLMSRELDVAQREYRLRAAAMYADAGNRLRNSTSWDKEDAAIQAADRAKAESGRRRQAASRRHAGRSPQGRSSGLGAAVTFFTTPGRPAARRGANPAVTFFFVLFAISFCPIPHFRNQSC